MGSVSMFKMPFGLKSSLAVFMRCIPTVLEDFIRRHEIILYIDDILIVIRLY